MSDDMTKHPAVAKQWTELQSADMALSNAFGMVANPDEYTPEEYAEVWEEAHCAAMRLEDAAQHLAEAAGNHHRYLEDALPDEDDEDGKRPI